MPSAKDGKSEIAERLRATAEDLVELVTAQVKLMKLELVADARHMGARLARLAIFVPFVILGYAFAAGAGAYALGTRIGFAWSFALFGVVHAAVGTFGVIRAARTLRQVRVLDRSRDELERSLKTVTPALAPIPPTERA
jgi:hypothetical protein